MTGVVGVGHPSAGGVPPILDDVHLGELLTSTSAETTLGLRPRNPVLPLEVNLEPFLGLLGDRVLRAPRSAHDVLVDPGISKRRTGSVFWFKFGLLLFHSCLKFGTSRVSWIRVPLFARVLNKKIKTFARGLPTKIQDISRSDERGAIRLSTKSEPEFQKRTENNFFGKSMLQNNSSCFSNEGSALLGRV